MDKLLESEINTLITKRILVYHSQLISTGQIEEVALKGPSAIPLFSHYSQSACMQTDGPSTSPVLQQCDPLQSN